MHEYWILRKNGGKEYKTRSWFEYLYKRITGWEFVRKGVWVR